MKEVVELLEAILDKMYDIESELQDINTNISTAYNLDAIPRYNLNDIYSELEDINTKISTTCDIDDIYNELLDIENSVNSIE